jgi:hypothetical protein
MRNASRNTRFRRRQANGPTPARRSPRFGNGRKDARSPEWTTESWKHRVEAEARKRLKRAVGHLGTDRR